MEAILIILYFFNSMMLAMISSQEKINFIYWFLPIGWFIWIFKNN